MGKVTCSQPENLHSLGQCTEHLSKGCQCVYFVRTGIKSFEIMTCLHIYICVSISLHLCSFQMCAVNIRVCVHVCMYVCVCVFCVNQEARLGLKRAKSQILQAVFKTLRICLFSEDSEHKPMKYLVSQNS